MPPPPSITSVALHRVWSGVRSEYLSMEIVAQSPPPGVLRTGVRTRRLVARPGTTVSPAERVTPQLPLTVCVLDRRTALIPHDLQHLARGFAVVVDPLVVHALAAVHTTHWAAAAPAEPPPHLGSVLPLLAEGLHDEAAARQGGMSHRTYSRRVAELLAELGVRSRFAAGIEAARRGWL